MCNVDQRLTTIVSARGFAAGCEDLVQEVACRGSVNVGTRGYFLQSRRALLGTFVLDNSLSAESYNPIDSLEHTVREIHGSKFDPTEQEALLSIFCVNPEGDSAQIMSFTRVQDCPRLLPKQFGPGGATPLFNRIERAVGTTFNKFIELSGHNISARSITCIVSDGRPTDELKNGRTADGSRGVPLARIRRVLQCLAFSNSDIVCAVALPGAREHAFAEMGIPPMWTLTPAHDHRVRGALSQVKDLFVEAARANDEEFRRLTLLGFQS